MADVAKQTRTNQYTAVVAGVLLVFGAIRAVTVTASEYDPSTVVWMNFGFDLLLTLVLPFILVQIANQAEPGGLKTAALVLGGLGVLGGLVKVIARLSSDHGWWTGHFSYSVGG